MRNFTKFLATATFSSIIATAAVAGDSAVGDSYVVKTAQEKGADISSHWRVDMGDEPGLKKVLVEAPTTLFRGILGAAVELVAAPFELAGDGATALGDKSKKLQAELGDGSHPDTKILGTDTLKGFACLAPRHESDKTCDGVKPLFGDDKGVKEEPTKPSEQPPAPKADPKPKVASMQLEAPTEKANKVAFSEMINVSEKVAVIGDSGRFMAQRKGSVNGLGIYTVKTGADAGQGAMSVSFFVDTKSGRGMVTMPNSALDIGVKGSPKWEAFNYCGKGRKVSYANVKAFVGDDAVQRSVAGEVPSTPVRVGLCMVEDNNQVASAPRYLAPRQQ